MNTAKKISLICSIWLSVIASAIAQQDNKPYIIVSTDVPEKEYYQYEMFPFSFSIKYFGVRLSPNMSISGMPNTPYLTYSDFFEKPEKKVAKNYDVETTKTFECKAFSSTPGKLTISPTVHVNLLQRSRSFFGSGWIERPYEQKVEPITLNILPLPPDNRPSTFSNAVGSFTVKSTTESTNVIINSIIKLKIEIQGSGYMENIKAPVIGENENFKIYSPILIDKQDSRILYEQTVIPLSIKADTIPAVSFCYFNPDSSEYITTTSQPIKLKFHKEENGNKFETYKPKKTNEYVQASQNTHTTESSEPVFSEITPQNVNIALYIMNGIAVFIIAIIWIFFKKTHAVVLTLIIGLAAGVLTFATRRYIEDTDKYPICMVIQQTKAGIAPNSNALKTFQLNKGDMVYLKETYGEWSLVFRNKHYGWIKNENIKSR